MSAPPSGGGTTLCGNRYTDYSDPSGSDVRTCNRPVNSRGTHKGPHTDGDESWITGDA
jgi:hypothetical protein